MKDYRLPVSVAIPAAIGLIGVLWLLRRKSDRVKRASKASPKEEKCESKWSDRAQLEQRIQHIEREDITVSGRKIPETQARDRGSSDLKSQELTDSPEAIRNDVIVSLEKLDVEVSKNLDVGQEEHEVQALSITECGQGDGLASSQRVPIEHLVTTAVGDGVQEAHAKLSEPGSNSQPLNQMSFDPRECDQFASVEQPSSSGVVEDVLVHKTTFSELPTTFVQGNFKQKRTDLKIKTSTSDTQSLDAETVQPYPQVADVGTFSQKTTLAKLRSSVCDNTVETLEGGGDSRIDGSTALMTEQPEIVEATSVPSPHQATSLLPTQQAPEVSSQEQAASELSLQQATVMPSQEHASSESSLQHMVSETPLQQAASETSLQLAVVMSSLEQITLESSLQHASLESSLQHASTESSLQEASSASPVLPSSDSSSVLGSQSVVQNHSQVMTTLSKNLDQTGQSEAGYSSEPALQNDGHITTSTAMMATGNTNKSKHYISSNKKPPCDWSGARSPPGPWSPKTSTSSIDSLGPEEIKFLWGIEPSAENVDTSVSFVNTDSLILPLSADNSLDQTFSSCDLNSKQDTSSGISDSVPSENEHGNETAAVALSNTSAEDVSLVKSNSSSCDSNSEGSNDSGRGGSEHDVAYQASENLVHFEFNMPSELCGRFIGKHGKNINYLKSKAGVHVSLTNNPYTPDYQICQVVGSQSEVDDALAMIRRKFPLQEYPLLTMVSINMSPPPVVMQPDHQLVIPDVMQLSLPEGVSVDVFVSAIVDAGHLFVQQPTHRSFMSLEKLNYFLNLVYGQDPNVPGVPAPLEPGIICVCEHDGFWYRTMIMAPEDENGESQVKFVDYGGYANMPVSALKQIRADFMSLPFQAVECFMANVTPNQNEQFFSEEATLALSEMTQGKLLQCQVVARVESGIPYIHLYQISTESNSAVMINRALVNSRLVRWIEIL